MYEDGGIIKIRGQEYFAVFNTAGLEEITRRYGGLKELADTMNNPAGAIGEIAWLLSLMINQGFALKKLTDGLEFKAISEDDIKILMSPKELTGQADLIIQIINAGMGDEGDHDENEEIDEVLQEIEASKNGEGAGV